MDNRKMHLCLEAKDDQGRSSYLIYSAHFQVAALKDKSVSPPPLRFIREAVISSGVSSMGCGAFGSKLVLAGGLVKGKKGRDKKYRGVITYDRTTKQVSHEDIPVMSGGKFKPLLFQLKNNLYAVDTGLYPTYFSFEAYVPKHQHWHPLQFNHFRYLQPAKSEKINFFSWFVFGYCLCISLPNDRCTFAHQAMYHTFSPCHEAPLPFPGMAITYCQHEFQDVVLITLSEEGLVEGRRLCFHDDSTSLMFSSEKPVLIFDTKDYFQHDGVLTGCFAEFENGTFSLTASDNDNIYVYMFKISRRTSKNKDDLNLKWWNTCAYSYKYTDFSEEDYTSFSFAGCFATSPAHSWSKERTEAEIYRANFLIGDSFEEDDSDSLEEDGGAIFPVVCEYYPRTAEKDDDMDE